MYQVDLILMPIVQRFRPRLQRVRSLLLSLYILKSLDPGIEIPLHRLAVFPPPVHLLFCQRPQCVFCDLDRLVVME
jgi:hypothetical protein